MDTVSVIMPVYNGAKTISAVVKDYYEKIVKKIPNCEFIIAEDGSTDGTKDILNKLKKELPICVVSGNERKGYLRAIRDVLHTPKSEIIFFSDSDGEHDPEDFWKLYNKIGTYDLVIGYKVNRRPYYRKMLSWLNNVLIGILFNIWLKDSNCGFRIIRKRVIDDVGESISKMPIAPNAEFVIRAIKKGYSVKEVPISHIFVEGSVVFSPQRLPLTILKQCRDIFCLRIELWKSKDLTQRK